MGISNIKSLIHRPDLTLVLIAIIFISMIFGIIAKSYCDHELNKQITLEKRVNNLESRVQNLEMEVQNVYEKSERKRNRSRY